MGATPPVLESLLKEERTQGFQKAAVEAAGLHPGSPYSRLGTVMESPPTASVLLGQSGAGLAHGRPWCGRPGAAPPPPAAIPATTAVALRALRATAALAPPPPGQGPFLRGRMAPCGAGVSGGRSRRRRRRRGRSAQGGELAGERSDPRRAAASPPLAGTRRVGRARSCCCCCCGAPRMGRPVPLVLLVLLWRPCLCSGPCEPNAFRKDPSDRYCVACRVCDGENRAYAQPCSQNADAVCRCLYGHTCVEAVEECHTCHCAPGKENTDQGCQSCREGTFYNHTNGKCQPWSQCPGNKILTPGTKEKDVVCKPELKGPSQPPMDVVVVSTKLPEMESQLIPVSVALLLALLLFAFILLLSCLFFRSRALRKLLTLPHGQLAQEVDDCSYRYPEEEQGGSSESTEGPKEELLENIP
ncbi:tumor necrosis factor receptor superfamily member 9 [Elgaria multicarinata webbii]|uniref:tumor necrosis factor receptor superfamily member 9 n=1 Tax=Elgaria multicarinata webbii TaxID=159646 RepID=UPI002FCD5C1F